MVIVPFRLLVVHQINFICLPPQLITTIIGSSCVLNTINIIQPLPASTTMTTTATAANGKLSCCAGANKSRNRINLPQISNSRNGAVDTTATATVAAAVEVEQ